MNQDRWQTQKTVGFVFSALLAITCIVNVITTCIQNGIGLFQVFSSVKYWAATDFIIIALFFLFLGTSFVNNDFARFLQGGLFVVQGYIAIGEDWQLFWGWGLLLVAITLLHHYGFWGTKAKIKAILFSFLTSAIFIVSIINSREPVTHIVGFIVFAFFIFFFLVYTNRRELNRLLNQKKDIKKLVDRITHEKMLIEEIRERFENELGTNNIEDLMKKTQLQQAVIDNDKKLIRDILLSMSSGQNLSEGELDLLVCFVLNRGSLSNKELSFLLGTTEDAIKNRFRIIFQKMNASSRTHLYSQIIQR